jgi:acetyltransferase EpsM
LGANVHVKENAHIGLGACIRQGLCIGRNSIVGAGAVVVNDIPDNVVVVGVPARILRRVGAVTSRKALLVGQSESGLRK